MTERAGIYGGSLYDLAKEAYERAYAIMPNRLYPLYQLMMMYDEKGDAAMANEMAIRIRHSYVKIESNATAQMRHKADSIFYSYDLHQHPDKYVKKGARR